MLNYLHIISLNHHNNFWKGAEFQITRERNETETGLSASGASVFHNSTVIAITSFWFQLRGKVFDKSKSVRVYQQ